jgi:hypothetical protein
MFRKLATTVVALFTLTIATLTTFSSAYAADEVKLAFGSLQRDTSFSAGNCPSCYDLVGEVEVKNLAFAKEVWVWYSTGVGGWQSKKATFDAAIGNNKETWDFSISLGYIYPTNIQMAIQYKVNGAVYWDNNNNQNYRLGTPSAFSLLNTVNLFPSNTVFAMFDKLHGEIIVKNIAFQKQVKVVYTLDDWATSHEVQATFKAADGALAETWEFTADIPLFYSDDLPTIEYSIAYTVGGITYWDNNHAYGRNYQVTRFMGATR